MAPVGATTTACISTGAEKPGSFTGSSVYSPVTVRYAPGLPGSTAFAGAWAAGRGAGELRSPAGELSAVASRRRPPASTCRSFRGALPASSRESRKVRPSFAAFGTPSRRFAAWNSTRASPMGTGVADRHTSSRAPPSPVTRHPGGSALSVELANGLVSEGC